MFDFDPARVVVDDDEIVISHVVEDIPATFPMVFRVVQLVEEVVLSVSVDCVGITAIDQPRYVATDTGCSFATSRDAIREVVAKRRLASLEASQFGVALSRGSSLEESVLLKRRLAYTWVLAGCDKSITMATRFVY